MTNELRQDRPGSARFYLCPTSVKAGDAVLIGKLPAIAIDDYSTATLGTGFRLSGTFKLTVIAATTVSPLSGSDTLQGDIIYASGTLDATTNVTTGLTLSKQSSGGTAFGTYDSITTLATGTTSTSAPVKLKETA